VEKSEGTGEQTWFYTYDNENHLVSARETSDGTTNVAWSTFTYDALGERVAEQDWTSGGGGTTTRFVPDGSNVAIDLDGSNNALVRYLYGAGVNQILTRTVASGANAGPWVYLTDNQGSVRDLVNWSGQVEDHLDYSGYGMVTETNPLVGSRYEYDGYQYQATMGEDFTLARWYDPSTGTWQTKDPIGFFSGQSNLYQYVANDPTNAIDETGLSTELTKQEWKDILDKTGIVPAAWGWAAGALEDAIGQVFEDYAKQVLPFVKPNSLPFQTGTPGKMVRPDFTRNMLIQIVDLAKKKVVRQYLIKYGEWWDAKTSAKIGLGDKQVEGFITGLNKQLAGKPAKESYGKLFFVTLKGAKISAKALQLATDNRVVVYQIIARIEKRGGKYYFSLGPARPLNLAGVIKKLTGIPAIYNPLQKETKAIPISVR
jgi:RHS repeat-associated protein